MKAVSNRSFHPIIHDLGLVEEFIHDFEGTGNDHDVTKWSQFTDIKDIKEEMLLRLDEHFEKWLNP